MSRKKHDRCINYGIGIILCISGIFNMAWVIMGSFIIIVQLLISFVEEAAKSNYKKDGIVK